MVLALKCKAQKNHQLVRIWYHLLSFIMFESSPRARGGGGVVIRDFAEALRQKLISLLIQSIWDRKVQKGLL
jgi:hypothetical protein